MQLGGPKDEGSLIGPLISQKQLTRVLGYLDQGKSDGVEVVTGGYRLDRKGYFVHPTVLTNVASASRLFQEEIFGPVVDDHAVRRRGRGGRHWPTTAPTDWPPPPGPIDLGRAHRSPSASSRNGGAELPDAVRPLDALRRIQAVRLGLRSGKAGLETICNEVVWAQM